MLRLSLAFGMALSLGWTCIGNAHTLDLSWDVCSPLVTAKTVAPGGRETFFATVTGMGVPHLAYQIWWLLGDASQHVPDAWRFDAAGCNAFFFTYSAQPPPFMSKTCPPLAPIGLQQFPIAVYQLAPPLLGVPTTLGNGFLALSYTPGSPNFNPTQRYHAASFTHDFVFSSIGPTVPGETCGGFETPIEIRLIPNKCTWLTLNYDEPSFTIGNGLLLFQGAPVPARQATWGEIKKQYRR